MRHESRDLQSALVPFTGRWNSGCATCEVVGGGGGVPEGPGTLDPPLIGGYKTGGGGRR